MTRMKYVSYFLCLIILMMIIFGYVEYHYRLGFPDGHVDDFSYAKNIVYMISVVPLTALAGYFGYLGWVCSRRCINKNFALSFLFFILFIVSMVILNEYLFVLFVYVQGG